MIVSRMCDTDLYKFSMQSIVFHQFSDVNVKYEFKLRNYPPGTLTPYADEIRDEINSLKKLKMTDKEIEFLRSLPYFEESFISFLRHFRLDPERFVKVYTREDGHLGISIWGPWLDTILFEVPILAIVSEVYNKNLKQSSCLDFGNLDCSNAGCLDCRKDDEILFSQCSTYSNYGIKMLEDKVAMVNSYSKPGFVFADFGTRRRHSKVWQETVVRFLSKNCPSFVGTSNVWLAMKYNLKPIGTMAHEYFEAMQALVRVSDSQKEALQCWANEYRGSLGIALSDTVGFDAFLRDFDLYFAKLFDGCRQDSGDPDVWCDKLISHYKKLNIDPKTKTAVFSDGLDIVEALRLHSKYHGRIQTSYGIGTNLTNDVGVKPMQIVIKMVRAGRGSDMRPVAKISDSPGKQMCEDEEYLQYLMKVFRIQEKPWRVK